MRIRRFVLTSIVAAALPASAANAQYFDVSPFLEQGQLLTGGHDHAGGSYPPPIRIYGYQFADDPLDPYYPTDPGVNQASGVGHLPAGLPLRYSILSRLHDWDGSGSPALGAPTGCVCLTLTMGASTRTLDPASAPQAGSLIQPVASDRSAHRHFVASLFAGPESSNVPADPACLQPPLGIYASSLDLNLADADTIHTSDPSRVLFNNGLSEEDHDALMHHIASSAIPEPGALPFLARTPAMLRRRR